MRSDFEGGDENNQTPMPQKTIKLINENSLDLDPVNEKPINLVPML